MKEMKWCSPMGVPVPVHIANAIADRIAAKMDAAFAIESKPPITVPCKHCGTPVEPDGRPTPVLCADCARAMFLSGAQV